jgi:hypothetical protein
MPLLSLIIRLWATPQKLANLFSSVDLTRKQERLCTVRANASHKTAHGRYLSADSNLDPWNENRVARDFISSFLKVTYAT